MQPSTEALLNRRAVLGGAAGLIAVAGVTAVPGRALALSTGQATSLIQQVVDQVLSIVNGNTSTGQAMAQFERMFDRYADVNVIAQSVLGPPWRSASGAQKSAFVAAFKGYLSRKYGSEFREFRGASMQITGATDHGNKGVVVSSIVNVPGSAPVTVEWQVSDRSGSPKMFNMFIEGVSMLSTERSEVRAILEANRNSIDGLIADLKRRG